MSMNNDLSMNSLIKENTKIFNLHFGEFQNNSDSVEFISPPKYLSKVVIKGKKRKFMLGGIYSTQITGELVNKIYSEEKSPIKLKYKGVMIKQGVSFYHSDIQITKNIVDRLNTDKKLLELLNMIDLEDLNIWIKDKKYIIEIIPMSGSYMYMVIPPMKYSNHLKKDEIDNISNSVIRISDILSFSKEGIL